MSILVMVVQFESSMISEAHPPEIFGGNSVLKTEIGVRIDLS